MEPMMTTPSSETPSAIRTFAERAVTLAVVVMGLLAGSGCVTVAPYERGKLAHPTMSAGDMTGFGESHLRAISRGRGRRQRRHGQRLRLQLSFPCHFV